MHGAKVKITHPVLYKYMKLLAVFEKNAKCDKSTTEDIE
jgi:hypothetical protein